MHPEAGRGRAADTPLGLKALPDWQQAERASRSIGDDVELGDVKADIEVWRGLARRLEPHTPVGVAEDVAGIGAVGGVVETDGLGGGRKQQADVHLRRIEGARDRVERGGAVLDPRRVDIADPDRAFAQQRDRLLQAAAGLQRFGALVGDQDARGLARRQMRFELVGEGMNIDHGGLDPRIDQTVKRVVDQGAAGNHDQGLGPVVGQGPHAHAEAGGQHHGGFRPAHACGSRTTLRANQALSGAISGASRQRSR